MDTHTKDMPAFKRRTLVYLFPSFVMYNFFDVDVVCCAVLLWEFTCSCLFVSNIFWSFVYNVNILDLQKVTQKCIGKK